VRRLTLFEFGKSGAVALSPVERDAILCLHPGILVEPTRGSEGLYDLTPDQRIGVVCLPDCVIEVRPKLSMASVLFLVSYACDAAKWHDGLPEFAEADDFVGILAVMLSRVVSRTTRRGLLNGYQSEEDTLQAPRGRILFDEQVRRRLGFSPPVEVRHDVFTADIIENRVLLAALEKMSGLPLESQRVRRELARARGLFGAVRRVYFRPAYVPTVRITQLNRHYESAIALASLVLRSASVELGTDGVRGSAFLIDMNDVFEEFVRKALRVALGSDARRFPDRPPPTRLDIAGVVPLRPDLCLLEEHRIVWVGDAKYKRLPAGAYRNADLYQLLAYATALNLSGGTLIYAADEGVSSAEHVVVNAGKRLHVVALDLTAPPANILRQVRRIALGMAATSAAPDVRSDGRAAERRPA
jgi:5-methylcytosine-specific restriction enzyme subunit McrC